MDDSTFNDYVADFPGWAKLIRPIIDACEQDKVEIYEIKEKFGGLRVYPAGNASFDIEVMIDAAEIASLTVCMQCGKPGKRENCGGWLLVVCPEHSKVNPEADNV